MREVANQQHRANLATLYDALGARKFPHPAAHAFLTPLFLCGARNYFGMMDLARFRAAT